MCGRITQISTRYRVVQELGVQFSPLGWIGGDVIPQYNLAPQATIMVFSRLNNGVLKSHWVPWGYRPAWAKEKGYRLEPNAKVEKAATGTYFRHMWKSGRVLVPADGWYEWTGEKPNKQPWYIRSKSGTPMFFAAVTNFIPYKTQTVEVGVVLVTEQADEGIVDVHDRRPVIFTPEDARTWMEPDLSPDEATQLATTRSRPSSDFTWYKVSPAVNKAVSMASLSQEQAASLIKPIN